MRNRIPEVAKRTLGRRCQHTPRTEKLILCSSLTHCHINHVIVICMNPCICTQFTTSLAKIRFKYEIRSLLDDWIANKVSLLVWAEDVEELKDSVITLWLSIAVNFYLSHRSLKQKGISAFAAFGIEYIALVLPMTALIVISFSIMHPVPHGFWWTQGLIERPACLSFYCARSQGPSYANNKIETCLGENAYKNQFHLEWRRLRKLLC